MVRASQRRTRKSPAAKQSKAARRTRASLVGPGAAFSALADAALARGEPDAVADEDLRRVMAAALKVYAAKAERRDSELKPFDDGAITPTEAVVAACALIRAADLNLFDVAMWFHRAPRATST